MHDAACHPAPAVRRSALLLALLMVVAVSLPELTSATECRDASDCLPVSCCGASVCVPQVMAERDCDKPAKSCTMDCKPGTVDCGGFCTCTATGKCAASLNKLDPVRCSSKMRKRGECV